MPHAQPAARWVTGFGLMFAQLGGSLGDRFDVVLHVSGPDRFEDECARARSMSVEGVRVYVLPLDRAADESGLLIGSAPTVAEADQFHVFVSAKHSVDD